MDAERRSGRPTSRRYPAELKERAVRLVLESHRPEESWYTTVRRVAPQLDVGVESLRTWTRQARIDEGRQPGLTTDERARLSELERENRELRRANEILKAASAFFARELDPRFPR
jgi:transposase